MTGATSKSIKYLRLGILIGLGILCTTPIWTNTSLYFPFITTKALVFRVTVELLLIAYLALAGLEPLYRVRLRPMVLAFAIFAGLSLVSALTGTSPVTSILGDLERSEALVTWLHLLALLVILCGVLRTVRQWQLFFDVFVASGVVVALVSIGQVLNIDFITNTTGSRVSSTIGNAAYLGSYSLFIIFFCALLASVQAHWAARLYYAVVAITYVFILVRTETRGAVLGLLVALILATIAAVVYSKKRWLQAGFAALTLGSVIFGFILVANKNTSWVTNSTALSRLATISFKDRSVQTRLWAWQSAWQGWTESPQRFFLGYGMENFSVPFDKYFNPLHYEDAGSTVWFDRAHNFIFDRGLTGGILGLLSYLSLAVLALYLLWKRHRSEPQDRYWLIIISILLVAHLVQNLFVFDSIVSYIPWVMVLAFVQVWAGTPATSEQAGPDGKRTWYFAAAALLAVGFVPTVYYLHYRPTIAGRLAISALRDDREGKDPAAVYEKFTRALDFGTYGNQEFRIQFAETVDDWVLAGRLTPDFSKSVVERLDQELALQIKEVPVSAANYLLAVRHWYNTRSLRNLEAYYFQARQYLDKAIALSPTRPETYHEVGYMEIAVADTYHRVGRSQDAAPNYEKAEAGFRQAVDLNPATAESYMNLALVGLATNDQAKVRAILAEAREHSWSFRNNPVPHLEILGRNAVSYGRFAIAREIYLQLVQLEPANATNWIQLALSYAFLGENDKAIEIAEQLKKANPQFAGQADQFIKQVKDGFFKEEANKYQGV